MKRRLLYILNPLKGIVMTSRFNRLLEENKIEVCALLKTPVKIQKVYSSNENIVKHVRHDKLTDEEKQGVIELVNQFNDNPLFKIILDLNELNNVISVVNGIRLVEENKIIGICIVTKLFIYKHKTIYKTPTILINPIYRGSGYSKISLERYFSDKRKDIRFIDNTDERKEILSNLFWFNKQEDQVTNYDDFSFWSFYEHSTSYVKNN